MSLRDKFLEDNHGNADEAAAELAHRLTLGDPVQFKIGYTPENAILAAMDIFPDASEKVVRHVNGWEV